jgi:hypothetical protein
MQDVLNRIHPITTRPAPVSTESLDTLEAAWGRLPEGYREFLTALGVGTLTTWVRVQSPRRIEAEREEWREGIAEYWLWDDPSGTGLDQRRATECVRFADTMGGDQLIAHPDDPDALYLLPRHSDHVLQAGRGLGEALTWLHESGELTAPLELWYFEPWIAWLHLHAAGTGAEHDAIVAAIESTGMVRQRSDANEEEEEDGPFTTLLLPSIGGMLTVCEATGVALLCDLDADPRLLKGLERALAGVGCVVGQPEQEPAPSYSWLA